MARLGDICKIKSAPEAVDENLHWLLNLDVVEQQTGRVLEYNYVPEEKLNGSIVQFGTANVLYSKLRPNLNKVVVPDCAGYATSEMLPLLPDERVITRAYLAVFLRSDNFVSWAVSKTAGAKMPRLGTKELLSKEIPLPSIAEQRIITEQFAAVDELITAHKKQLSKLDELVKSRFIELFGENGKQVPLTEYVWFQEGPGVRSVNFTDEGTILLTGSNINNNTISFGYKSDRHISKELSEGKYAHFMCDIGDILVVSSAIEPSKFDQKVVTVAEDKKYCLNTGIIRFKPNTKYLTIEYFREFLKTDYFKHQVMAEMRGIAQMHFGPSHLKQMTILLPDSIERQNKFAAFVEQTDKLKLEVKQSLEKLETLKKSLMQEYFG